MWGDAFPFGLVSIAMYLRRHKNEVKVIDLMKQKIPENYFPDVIGIGGSTPYVKNAIECCKEMRAKFPKAKIILGGPHFSALPDEGTPYADVVVIGPGEKAFLEICKNGVTTPIVYGEYIDNLDDIPMPEIDLLDLLYKGRVSRLHVVGQRGCPFNCTFCAEHSHKIRSHSTKYFVDYLQIVSEIYHNDIFISDDIFCIDKERTTEICELIIKRKLDLRLNIFGHINLFNPELFQLMKKAGVKKINYGIESGNNEILKSINKHFTIEKAEKVIKETKGMGFNVSLDYMVGNIGETEKTISDTIAFYKRNDTGFQWCSFAIPFPGTVFYKNAKESGIITTTDWDNYNNQTVIYIPNGLTAEFLIKARNAIMKSCILDKVKYRFGSLGTGLRLKKLVARGFKK